MVKLFYLGCKNALSADRMKNTRYEMKRVVVTGMGAVTPIGNSVEEFWDNIKKNTVGIGEITKFDVSDYKCKLAAEVKNFDPKQYMDPKAARRMEPFCQYAIAATGEAIKDAGLDLEKEDRTRIGTWRCCYHREGAQEGRRGQGEQSQRYDGAYDDIQHGSRQCGYTVRS